mgnify:CR=1 FL=1
MNKYSQRENNRYNPQGEEPFTISRSYMSFLWNVLVVVENISIGKSIKVSFDKILYGRIKTV